PGSIVRTVLPSGLTSLAAITSKSTTHEGETWTLTPIGTAIVNWSDGVCVVLPTLWNDTTGTAAPTCPPTMRVPLDGGGVGAAATPGGGVAAGAPDASWVSARAGAAAASVTATAARATFETTLQVSMSMVFSFHGRRGPLRGLSQRDRLRSDGERRGH